MEEARESFGYQSHKSEREIHMQSPSSHRLNIQQQWTFFVLWVSLFSCNRRRSMLFLAERIDASSFQFLLRCSIFYPHHFMNFLSFGSQIVHSLSQSQLHRTSLSYSLLGVCVLRARFFSHFFHMQEMRIHLIPHERWLSFIFDNASKIL